MTPQYDLHSHSTASDGALSPTDLITRAQEKGVTTLALTDHDTTQGLFEAQQSAKLAGITLINGIEISTTWENHSLHIVGLNINPDQSILKTGINYLQELRSDRAQKISLKLEKKRIFGAYEAVSKTAGQGMITRSHFADFLLSQNHISTQQEAFDRYLGQGKAAYVSTTWASLQDTLDWITAAGGIAVLAHPMRYKLSANWMNRLLSAFKENGGQAIEVVTGRSSPEEINLTCQYMQRYGLYASVGSDFHSPTNQWVELGRLQPLPEKVTPVWTLF